MIDVHKRLKSDNNFNWPKCIVAEEVEGEVLIAARQMKPTDGTLK